jgi:hypothetical protein
VVLSPVGVRVTVGKLRARMVDCPVFGDVSELMRENGAVAGPFMD